MSKFKKYFIIPTPAFYFVKEKLKSMKSFTLFSLHFPFYVKTHMNMFALHERGRKLMINGELY